MRIDEAIRLVLDDNAGMRRKSWCEGVEIRAEHIRLPLDLISKPRYNHKGGQVSQLEPNPGRPYS